jgi:membrane-associated phospholipid phosphatase
MASAGDPREPPPTIGDVLADKASGTSGRVGSFAERALRELSSIDHAVYEAIAATPTPTLDEPFRRLSNAANRSVLWIGIAAALAAFGGRRGRRAAVAGLGSIGVSSAIVNLGLKSVWARARPDRAGVVAGRRVRMPSSTSFPSGHSASAFAFATAVGRSLPWLALPLRLVAALVAYSRVHTGVHYPGDAVVGSVVGGATGLVVGGVIDGRRR